MRVATVPAMHAYLDAVLPDDVVQVGPLPPPDDPWAPSPWLDPAYLAAHADQLDVLHLHFGFDALSPAEMTAWVAAVRAAGVPLVVTVHDLRNPHHDTPDRHDAHLAALLPAADALLTLTDRAAADIARRSGRRATVVPHPGLVEPRPAIATEPGLVGVHLKSLRANLREPLAVVRAVLAGAERAAGRLQVDVHRDVPLAAELTQLAAEGRLTLEVHPYADDDALIGYLQRLHVSVLPHRFGTHSGWLEACRDVGTRVVAPTCGCYADQWDDVLLYGNDERHGLDADSLADAVATALATPPEPPADPQWRAEQRRAVQARHAEAYAEVGGVRGARSPRLTTP